MRDAIFALLLLSACASIVIGVASWSTGAAWVTAGVLGIVWSWLVFVFGEAGVAALAGDVE